MKDKIFILGSGHGGMISGVSMTNPKMGKYYKFPNGEIAYEGVINRLIKHEVIKAMTTAGLKTFDVCPTEMDIELDARCDIVNTICREYGNDRCIYIPLHSNAGGGRGFEIWTSPGQTRSDVYATTYFKTFSDHFPHIKTRQDTCDGDPDKESKFYELINTRCSALLPEFLFFDNWDDWVILRNPFTHKQYANMFVDFAKRVISE